MSAAKPVSPLTLATTRIVYAPTPGDDTREVDGVLVAKLLEIHNDTDHLFDPEHIAIQVLNVAGLLGRLADSDHSDDDEGLDGALYLLADVLRSLARRLTATRGNMSAAAGHYRIEPAEAAR